MGIQFSHPVLLFRREEMARRKQKHLIVPEAAFGLAVTIGAIWLASQLLFSRRFLESIGLAILLGGGLTAAYLIVRHSRRVAAQNSLVQKAHTAIEWHLRALAVRRAQLVWQDAYGNPQMDKWETEKDRFITQQIEPSLTVNERLALERDQKAVAYLIEARVAGAIQSQPSREFSSEMTPAEFENFCAEELHRAGWSARVTRKGRDQGVDIVAEKGAARVVIQCKLYTRPVGNKAVQEATAARAHEQGTHGIVVTNQSYTSAARQLASTNGILLLHYSELRNLNTLVCKDR